MPDDAALKVHRASFIRCLSLFPTGQDQLNSAVCLLDKTLIYIDPAIEFQCNNRYMVFWGSSGNRIRIS